MVNGFAAILGATLGLMTLEVQDERPITIGAALTLRSQVLGEDRTVLVHLPEGNDGHPAPVLYLLEGQEHFQHATATVEVLARAARIPPLIVVGVENADRLRELTPTPIAPIPGSGGADRFLAFLTRELVPFIEARFATHPFRILAGHSHGGLLALHAFERGTVPVHAFIAISPALAWDSGELVTRLARTLPERRPRTVDLFLAMGSEEPELSGPFLQVTRSLGQLAPDGPRWSQVILPGDDHGTSALRGMAEGLTSAFAAWRAPDDLVRQGDVAALLNHVTSATARFGSAAAVDESRTNDLGYRLLAEGRMTDAIAVLRLNVQAYPDSANASDSLGDAYERAGRLVEAAVHFEQAIQLGQAVDDPALGRYRDNLQRVRTRIEREGAGGRDAPPPDLASAFAHGDAGLQLALEHSIGWLESSARPPTTPAALDTTRLLLQLLRSSRSAADFDREVRDRFEIAVAEDCLFTGYFAPEHAARLHSTEGFRHPIYRRPPWLSQGTVGPTRATIEEQDLLAGLELAWLPDALSAYLAHVNGSVRLILPGGQILCASHCGTNELAYTSLGAELIAAGLSSGERMSMQEIERLFVEQPERLCELMRRNDRYVFFAERPCAAWPEGAFGIALTPAASLAADANVIPRGSVVLVEIDPWTLPPGAPAFPRLMVNHDQGAAIVSARRADLFMGVGEAAGEVAGRLRASGRMHLLVARQPGPAAVAAPHEPESSGP